MQRGDLQSEDQGTGAKYVEDNDLASKDNDLLVASLPPHEVAQVCCLQGGRKYFAHFQPGKVMRINQGYYQARN